IDLGLDLLPVDTTVDKSFGLQLIDGVTPDRKIYSVFSGISGPGSVCQQGGLWAYEVDVPQALAADVHVTNVSAPASVNAGSPFSITLDTTLACSTATD